MPPTNRKVPRRLAPRPRRAVRRRVEQAVELLIDALDVMDAKSEELEEGSEIEQDDTQHNYPDADQRPRKTKPM